MVRVNLFFYFINVYVLKFKGVYEIIFSYCPSSIRIENFSVYIDF